MYKFKIFLNLHLWYIRTFKVITTEQAKSLNLTFIRNVYGDEINKLNCRSIWFDSKTRTYRVKE